MALSLSGSDEGASMYDDAVALVPQDPSMLLPVSFCSSTDFFNLSSTSLEVDSFLQHLEASDKPAAHGRKPRGRPKGTTWAAGYKVSAGRPKKDAVKNGSVTEPSTTSPAVGAIPGDPVAPTTPKLGHRGRPKGSTRANGFKVSTGRPVGTTRQNGYRVSTGRPSGTTRSRGCKASAGRPKKRHANPGREMQADFSSEHGDLGEFLPVQVMDISPGLTVPTLMPFLDATHSEYF